MRDFPRAVSAVAARWRSTVLTRARSRLAWPTRDGFFATPMESWNRRLNSSSVSSFAFCPSSSPDISRHVTAFMIASDRPRPGHELGLDPELLGREPEPVPCSGLVHTFHLVEDAPWLDHRHPALGITLALAHPGLGGLLGDRLVREDTNEDLPAPPPAPRERHTSPPPLPPSGGATRAPPRSAGWSPSQAPAPSSRSRRRRASTRAGPCRPCAHAGPCGT